VFDSLPSKLKPEETPISANSANSGYTSSYSAVNSDINSEPGEPFEYKSLTNLSPRSTSPVLDKPIVETPIQDQGEAAGNFMDEQMKNLNNRPYVREPEVDNYNIHSPLEEYYYLALINP
jgi:hypothetical protein